MSLNRKNLKAVDATDDAEPVDQCKSELPYITKSYEVSLSRYDTPALHFCRAYLRHAVDAEEVTQVFTRAKYTPTATGFRFMILPGWLKKLEQYPVATFSLMAILSRPPIINLST